MQTVLNVYKPQGYTPFEIVQKVKDVYPHLKNIKIGYAGRLDPMADGVLLLLIGEENKQKLQYEHLDKKYEFEFITGIKTDSYDLLGLVQNTHFINTSFSSDKVKKILHSFLDKKKQEYPPFSSVHVKGKPLFYWAREKRLEEIAIPTKEISIKKIKLISHDDIQSTKLKSIISQRISKVSGNFRQKKIITKWYTFFEKNESFSIPIYKCSIQCSSGTYIRGLVHEAGALLGTGATTLSISRISVGNNTIDNSIDLFTKST